MKRKKLSLELPYTNDNEPAINVTLPSWAQAYFRPYRYIVNVGGRGSMKSYTAAGAAVLRAYEKRQLFLCAREFLNSISESVHSVIVDRIEAFGLLNAFDIKKNEIICKHNGSRFIFRGLDKNVYSVKSMPNIDVLWIEEADTISQNSWDIVIPTIRNEGSQIWLTFNPRYDDDIVYKMFVANPPPEDSFVIHTNWKDNPYLSQAFLKDKDHMANTDYGKYLHVYEGQLLTNSDAQIFNGKWFVEDFVEDERAIKYYGLDFGTSDPCAAIRSYIKDNKLYITHEVYKTKLDVDEIGEYCSARIPGFRNAKIMADSARPDNISFMCRQGFRVEGAEKGKGSIDDGIDFLKSFDMIIIHPRCVKTAYEMRRYSYKVDKKTEKITNKIVDDHNHIIDSLRYSYRKLMNKRRADYATLNRM